MTFEITHPFHPQRGTQWVLVTRKGNWGEDRVMYYDRQGRLRSMRTSWTSLADQDLLAKRPGAAPGFGWTTCCNWRRSSSTGARCGKREARMSSKLRRECQGIFAALCDRFQP